MKHIEVNSTSYIEDKSYRERVNTELENNTNVLKSIFKGFDSFYKEKYT